MRRLGFDVMSIGRDSGVDDALLGFQAEIVIANHQSRNVDGLKLSRRVKKKSVPPPRIALSYAGSRPTLTDEDQKTIDALIEIPAAGENAIRLLATLGGVPLEPLLEKYRKFANAKLTQDEDVVIIRGARAGAAGGASGAGVGGAVGAVGANASAGGAEFDPVKTPGQAAVARSDRSNKYDLFLEMHQKDLAHEPTTKVIPRDRAQTHMKRLKEDSKNEQEALGEIQKQKIKFAEALFESSKPDEKKKT